MTRTNGYSKTSGNKDLTESKSSLRVPSRLEETLLLHLRLNELPEPEREYKFHPKRRFRFDFAWPASMIAVEVEGGIWTGGRHSRGAGLTKDCEKYNEAVLLGWQVLRVVDSQIDDGSAIDWIRRAHGFNGAERPPF